MDRSATDAAMNFFVSGGGPGKFGNHSISWDLYGFYYSRCKEKQSRIEAQFGGMDLSNPMFARFSADNCVKQTLGSLYALKDMGAELSLHISTESIKADIAKQARESAASQNVIHEDEKLTPQEIYRRLLNQVPFEARQLEKNARYTQVLTTSAIEVPQEILAQKDLPGQVKLNLSVIRWENAALLKDLKEKVILTESQIKKQYEEEQAKLKDSQKKNLEEERAFLVERMKAEQARKKLGNIKQQLSNLKSGFRLADVNKITGMAVQDVSRIGLDELDKVNLGNSVMNLDTASFYKSLRMNTKSAYSTGPHQDGGFTVYVQVNSVENPGIIGTKIVDEQKQIQLSKDLGRELGNALLEQSSKRGALKLNVKPQTQG